MNPSSTDAPDWDPGGLNDEGWRGAGSEQAESWWYAQLECTLQPGEELQAYETYESGSVTNDNIYSPGGSCLAMTSTDPQTSVVDPLDQIEWAPSSTSQGPFGFLEAPGGKDIYYQCYLPNNWTQFSLKTPASTEASFNWAFSSTGPWGLNSNGTGQTNTDFGPYSDDAEWPTAIFPSTSLPANGASENSSGTFLDTTSVTHFYFQQHFSHGQSRW
jgi:hypothetical protein